MLVIVLSCLFSKWGELSLTLLHVWLTLHGCLKLLGDISSNKEFNHHLLSSIVVYNGHVWNDLLFSTAWLFSSLKQQWDLASYWIHIGCRSHFPSNWNLPLMWMELYFLWRIATVYLKHICVAQSIPLFNFFHQLWNLTLELETFAGPCFSQECVCIVHFACIFLKILLPPPLPHFWCGI